MIQKWILHRYVVSEARKVGPATSFVDMPLKSIGDDNICCTDSANLVNGLSHIWITGPPGMGKTALVKHLRDVAFAPSERVSVSSVLKHFGYVPILATLRDYGLIDIDLKSEPDGWVVAIAQRVLAAGGVPIQDKGLLRGFLRSGRIVLILDGANETDRSAEICEYARMNRETRLLVTSQIKPNSSSSTELFAVFSLPNKIDQFIEPLVQNRVGAALATRLLAHITKSGLRSSILNGYDVRLVVDLAMQVPDPEALPTTRLGLYQGCLSFLNKFSDSEETVASLTFRAWKMFAHGDRRFSIGDLSAAAAEALFDPIHPILRRVGVDQAEFRHDQMRAFFAAKYIASFPIDTKVATLRESEVWAQRRDEQETLWSFVAELSDTCNELGILWLFSIERPENGILQQAVQLVGKARNCPWFPSAAIPYFPAGTAQGHVAISN